ncbi:MAG TPA: hypothetical protein VJ327_03650 [Patescibacteria group bacterium]|nr:hypothetical protein [Patescibacteria group bacterium]
MALPVTFTFRDSLARKTTRTWVSVGTTIAAALADVAVLAPLVDAISQGGLQKVTITAEDTGDAFAADAGSNVDENASITVLAADGRNYDLDLPMPITALRLAGGSIDTANADFIAFIAAFGVAANWRLNVFAPTAIVSVEKALLDT